jgi:hypothetical protein
MSIFEYLMVLVSIILGLGMTQTLRGLSKIARGDAPYVVLTLWAAFLGYVYVQVWWALWDLNEVTSWNQGYFTLIVLIPCSMFAATELLVPMGTTSETDWRAHFFRVRRWFFAVMILFTLLATFETYLLLGVALTHPYRLMQFGILGLLIVGLVSANPRIHPWLPTLAIASMIVSQVAFRFVPGLAA